MIFFSKVKVKYLEDWNFLVIELGKKRKFRFVVSFKVIGDE